MTPGEPAHQVTGRELTGRVVRPADAAYEQARRGWNLLHAHRPAAVVYARDAEDVVQAVAWAREQGMPLRVRSGGHCLEGWNSVDDGLVVDVSELKGVETDAGAGTVTVGAGLDQLEAVTALAAAGVAVPTGTEGSVGLVGATLGGGFGLLTRAFGMACDHLVAADVVVASGDVGAELLTVDVAQHPDLLWALRGAGNGSFGVVTSLTYRVHPLTEAILVTATWPGLSALAPLFAAWQSSAPHTDDRLTSQLEIHREEVVLFAVLASGDGADALRLLAPVLGVGDPTVATRRAPWGEVYAGLQIPLEDEPASWVFASQLVSAPFPPEAVEVVATFMAQAPTPECNYFTNAFGGALRRAEPEGGAAFAHRDALFYAEPGAGWGERGGIPAADDPLTPVCRAWVADFAAALAPYVDGAYVNVPNAGMPDWERAYWGDGVDRLRAVKAAYDPHDVFSYEQSVRGEPRTA